MIRFAVCDDEDYFLKNMKNDLADYIKNHRTEAHITEFSSGENLLKAEFNFDILLMDIKLGGRNGIDIVKQLRTDHKSCQVIFITSYQDYAFQAFDVDAVHYLQKPVKKEQLNHALDKALRWIRQSDCRTLTISRGNTTQRIFIQDIVYCEAVDHKIFIRTATEHYDYFGTLDALEKKLDRHFFRCHRSYIVNLNFVVSREKGIATVTGGDKILVSRRKQQEFAQKLLTLFREEVL